jgi:hypothetical protein
LLNCIIIIVIIVIIVIMSSSSSSNPFGVTLKSPRSAVKARVLVSKVAIDLSNRRQSLRHVKTPPPKVKRVDSTGKKYLKRVAGAPFTIRQSPVFGVVLRSNAITETKKEGDNDNGNDEDEDDKTQLQATGSAEDGGKYLDLDFREDKEKFNKKDSIETHPGILEERVVAPFGVRLKPTRRFDKSQAPNPSRTYQIDLNPVKGQTGGTYQKSPKSFLEIKLRTVKRDPKAVSSNDQQPEFVELRLRHVVAAEDGGPGRTVTEVCFQIPINLRHVSLDELRRPGDGHLVKHDPLEDLLQITIASLNHVVPQKRDIPPAEHNITFNLTHIDPKTRELIPLGHSFDIKLRNTPRSDNAKEREVPSMQINLRKVNRDGSPGTDHEKPEFADIQLKHVKVTEEEWLVEEEEEEYEEIVEEELMGDEYEEQLLEDEFDEYEIDELAEKIPHNLRSSLPDLHLGEMALTSNDEDDANGSKKGLGDEEIDERETRSTLRKPPRRTRSSSLSEIDRMTRRRDHYITVKSKEYNEDPMRELTDKQRRDLLMWYNRMKTPNKEDMKRRVAKLPESCDITPEDVELLPWLCKGRYLDLRVMNKYFVEDWQGKDEYDKNSAGSERD